MVIPFETVNAKERKAQVEAYWAGEMGAEERETFVQENRVGYVLADSEIEDWKLMFEIGDVRLYDVRSE